MLTLAATATLAVLVWAGCYTFACWWWPFEVCPRCDGGGKFGSPSGRHWRNCRRCGGSGRRLRLGRRVWNWWHHKRKDATR